MTVAVEYRSPGTKEFSIRSESGSRLLIDNVFHKLLQSEKEALTQENQARVALNKDNYRYAAKYSSRCHFDRGLAAGNAMPWSEKRALFGEMEPR
jgi:hypothetical protein